MWRGCKYLSIKSCSGPWIAITLTNTDDRSRIILKVNYHIVDEVWQSSTWSNTEWHSLLSQDLSSYIYHLWQEWNLTFKLISPQPQHSYFDIWNFGESAASNIGYNEFCSNLSTICQQLWWVFINIWVILIVFFTYSPMFALHSAKYIIQTWWLFKQFLRVRVSAQLVLLDCNEGRKSLLV